MKPETWWCIKTGRILLPFTARATRSSAIWHFLEGRDRVGEKLLPHEKAVKLAVVVVPRRNASRASKPGTRVPKGGK